MPLIPRDPAAVFIVVWPVTFVSVTTDDDPAGSEIVAEATDCPSGSVIVPKSAKTGADPSSVSTFSLHVTVSLSIRPLALVSSLSRERIAGAAPSVTVRAEEKVATLFPEASTSRFPPLV